MGQKKSKNKQEQKNQIVTDLTVSIPHIEPEINIEPVTCISCGRIFHIDSKLKKNTIICTNECMNSFIDKIIIKSIQNTPNTSGGNTPISTPRIINKCSSHNILNNEIFDMPVTRNLQTIKI